LSRTKCSRELSVFLFICPLFSLLSLKLVHCQFETKKGWVLSSPLQPRSPIPPDPQIPSIMAWALCSLFGCWKGWEGRHLPLPTQLLAPTLFLAFFTRSLAGSSAPDFSAGESNREDPPLCSPSFCCAPLYHYSAEFWDIRRYLCLFLSFSGPCSLSLLVVDHSPQTFSLLGPLHSHLFSRGDLLTPISPSSLSPSPPYTPTSYLSFIKSVCLTSERLTRVILLFLRICLAEFVILRGTRSGFLLLPETPTSVLHFLFFTSHEVAMHSVG
jgi:hypothetical protein